jgi:hypothetical protein
MGIQRRPMRPKDVRECVGIVASHPVLGPRYGSAIHELNSVWLSLLGREAFRAFVFEESRGANQKILGAGVSAFVRGRSPLLSDRETREGNTDGGLNLLVWEGIVRPEDFLRVEVNIEAVSAFVEQHRGFLLKEVLSQCVNVEQQLSSVHGGAMFLDAGGQYVDTLPCPVAEALAKPHFIGMTRQIALSRAGSWIGSIFLYQPARFGFRPSEQRLLLTALRGGTDSGTRRRPWRFAFRSEEIVGTYLRTRISSLTRLLFLSRSYGPHLRARQREETALAQLSARPS